MKQAILLRFQGQVGTVGHIQYSRVPIDWNRTYSTNDLVVQFTHSLYLIYLYLMIPSHSDTLQQTAVYLSKIRVSLCLYHQIQVGTYRQVDQVGRHIYAEQLPTSVQKKSFFLAPYDYYYSLLSRLLFGLPSHPIRLGIQASGLGKYLPTQCNGNVVVGQWACSRPSLFIPTFFLPKLC